MIGLNKIVFFSSKFNIIVSIFLTLVPHLEHLASSRYFAVSRSAFCFSFKKIEKYPPETPFSSSQKNIYIKMQKSTNQYPLSNTFSGVNTR